jgi:hypothetical protein
VRETEVPLPYSIRAAVCVCVCTACVCVVKTCVFSGRWNSVHANTQPNLPRAPGQSGRGRLTVPEPWLVCGVCLFSNVRVSGLVRLVHSLFGWLVLIINKIFELLNRGCGSFEKGLRSSNLICSHWVSIATQSLWIVGWA